MSKLIAVNYKRKTDKRFSVITILYGEVYYNMNLLIILERM